MAVLRGLIGLIGILAMLMGLFWVLQGLGIVMWPAESFMLADRKWALYGALVALVGLSLIWVSRRR